MPPLGCSSAHAASSRVHNRRTELNCNARTAALQPINFVTPTRVTNDAACNWVNFVQVRSVQSAVNTALCDRQGNTNVSTPNQLNERRRHTMRKQGSCLEKEIMQGTMPGARRRGRPRTAWTDNIKTWTGVRTLRGRVSQNDRGQG